MGKEQSYKVMQRKKKMKKYNNKIMNPKEYRQMKAQKLSEKQSRKKRKKKK